MKHALIGRWLPVCLCLLAVPILTAQAKDPPRPWKVDGKLLGEADGASDFKKSKDVSGIACDRSSGFHGFVSSPMMKRKASRSSF
jgi:hypothetical protein